jgi:hypothetical protein
MAAITKGIPVYVWGTNETITNANVTNISTTKSYGNVQTVVNFQGNEIEKRMDDTVETGTVTLQYEAAFAPATAGSNITFPGAGASGADVVFYITGIADSHTNNGFRETTYNIKKTEYITLT